MATDIADVELNGLRNALWDKAFMDNKEEDSDVDRSRKASVVIEHLIQASDVSHTMQVLSRMREERHTCFLTCPNGISG
jgi:hypothetical protein